MDNLQIFECYLKNNNDINLTAIELHMEPAPVKKIVRNIENTTLGNILKSFYIQFARNFHNSSKIQAKLGDAFERILDEDKPDEGYIKLAMQYLETNSEIYKDINSIHNLLHTADIEKNFFNIPKELPDGTVDSKDSEI